MAGVVAGALSQFVGALYVREFARGLWGSEMREERFRRATESGGLGEERGFGGLPVIDEELEWEAEKL